MKLKSYFAGSVEAALSQARRELGADAMLVNSQRTSVEFRHLGEYEVVFAVTPGSLVDTRTENFQPAPPAKAHHHVDKLSQEVSELRQQMERWLQRSRAPAQEWRILQVIHSSPEFSMS